MIGVLKFKGCGWTIECTDLLISKEIIPKVYTLPLILYEYHRSNQEAGHDMIVPSKAVKIKIKRYSNRHGFGDPALFAELPIPMVHERVRHLLPHLYRRTKFGKKFTATKWTRKTIRTQYIQAAKTKKEKKSPPLYGFNNIYINI
ncbi:hypothetical protein CLU79DRAFT_215683 [Phycomyces nitens]|nr:hypothetical protein CLU79DRAFT_215683 [Phycomyces nitens]